MDDNSRGKVSLPRVTQHEPEDLKDLVETELFVELTPEDAPGFAKNGVMQPLPRAVGCLYRPGKIAHYGAPHVGDTHHLHHERLLIPSPIGRTVIEFERCRQVLKHAIKHCFKLDFSYVASAISCVLNSLRPLHTWEVDTAIGLFVEYADTEHPAYDEDEVPGKTWLPRCASFLVVDDDGLVHFASGFMPQFLRQFRIRGIDATHQTIATACLIQVDLDDKSQSLPLTSFAPCLPADSSSEFSDYAEKYWRDHCRSAEQSCQDLSTAACVGPSSGRTLVPRDSVWRSAANANADLDTIGIEHLTLCDSEDDETDWVVVDDIG